MELPPAIDITLVMGTEMSVHPGDAPPSLRRLSSIHSGDPLTSSEITLGCHVGTHVDAPSHFVRDGASIGELPLESFYGEAVVVDLDNRDSISAGDLAGLTVAPSRHILLKTRNSRLLGRAGFDPGYCVLAPEAAAALLQYHPRSIGFDYYSLDPPSVRDFPAHGICARAGLPVFVCLDLRNAAAGEYFFCGLPLKIAGVEAAPVRALLFAAGERGVSR